MGRPKPGTAAFYRWKLREDKKRHQRGSIHGLKPVSPSSSHRVKSSPEVVVPCSSTKSTKEIDKEKLDRRQVQSLLDNSLPKRQSVTHKRHRENPPVPRPRIRTQDEISDEMILKSMKRGINFKLFPGAYILQQLRKDGRRRMAFTHVIDIGEKEEKLICECINHDLRREKGCIHIDFVKQVLYDQEPLSKTFMEIMPLVGKDNLCSVLSVANGKNSQGRSVVYTGTKGDTRCSMHGNQPCNHKMGVMNMGKMGAVTWSLIKWRIFITFKLKGRYQCTIYRQRDLRRSEV